MKIAAVAMMVVSGIVFAAPTLQWTPSPDGVVTGHNMYCGPSLNQAAPATTLTATPVAMPAVTLDMAGILVPGTRYECYVTATAPNPNNPAVPLESASSNHIWITPPTPPVNVEYPGQPSQMIIQFTPTP